MAESQAPLLQLNQFFVYLRDHLLLDKSVDALILMPFLGTPGAIFAVATPKRKESRLIPPAYHREGRKSRSAGRATGVQSVAVTTGSQGSSECAIIRRQTNVLLRSHNKKHPGARPGAI
jgi:hypothetical protein